MKQILLSNIGFRPLSEFRYGGEIASQVDSHAISDREWCDFLFSSDGSPGLKLEWWLHIPSGIWYQIERDTGTNEFFLSQTKEQKSG